MGPGSWPTAPSKTIVMPVLGFGYGVTVAGGEVVVGSGGYGGHRATDSKLYVFKRSGNTWPSTADPVLSGHTSIWDFGWVIEQDENTMVVGAPSFNSQKAFIFDRASSAQQWPNAATTSLTGYTAEIGFGNAVSISGDTIVVGSGGNGKAFIFTRSPTTAAWSTTAEAAIVGYTGEAGFASTNSLDVNDNTLAVGAGGARKVFIFRRVPGDLWGATAHQSLEGYTDVATFGSSVAISGNHLAVGASDAAKVYIFHRCSATADWGVTAMAVIDDYASEAGFGSHLRLLDGVLVVAAEGAKKVFVFTDAGTLPSLPSFLAS